MEHANPLKGKVALITGASRGIGEATARNLAKSGVKVVLAARSIESLEKITKSIKESGGDAAFVACDVTLEKDIIHSISFTETTFGGVDIIFANAGWEGGMSNHVHNTKTEDILKLVQTNLVAPILYAKYAVPAFQKRKGGIFLLNTSLGAFIGPDIGKMDLGLHLYGSLKEGLNQFGRMMTYYDKDNVKTFTVAPCVFATQMVSDIIVTPVMTNAGITSPQVFAGFNPVYKGQPGNPAFIGELILNLCQGTTTYKSGDVIVIDNDITWNGQEFYNRITLPGLSEYLPNQRDLKGEIKPVQITAPQK
jgi:NAD(P)-dependent dehydrogenase (short-subunit alcohol dehydrogenase family)